MTAFPKYPAYKDSGVEWLGDVPEHWEANRVFSIFNERVETGQGQLPILNVTISNGVQVEQFEGDRKKRLIEDRDAYKRAAAGDIAYNTMRMWQGAVGDVPVDGLVSPAYVVARPIKDINSRYYSFLFRGQTFQVETNRHSYGIVSDRNRLYWLGFKNIVVPIPPRAEQDRIVAFLDEKTAEIDRLIAKKQRQIELLDEQKAILINRAVTRGIRNGELGMVNEDAAEAASDHSTFTIPNSQFIDSGIPWIGPIPKHWQVRKLGAVVSFVSGATPSKDRSDFWNGGVPWISPKDMKRLKIDSSEDTISAAALKHTNIKLLSPGTVLIVVRGMILVRTVPIAVNTVHSTINQDIKGMEVNQAVMSPDFLLTLLTACQEMLTPLIEESGHGTRCLRTESLKTVLLPTPPRDEQDELVIRVQSISDASDKAKSNIESQIQTLQTLRSTLIAHAVTGKIKV